MDPNLRDYFGLTNGIPFQSFNDRRWGNDFMNGMSNLGNGHVVDHNFREVYSNNYSTLTDDPIPSSLPSVSSSTMSLGSSHLDHLSEDYDFSDSVLRYINQILMEEDLEGKCCMLQESLEHQALQDAEKSLYEVIGERYPPQLDLNPNPDPSLNLNPNYMFSSSESTNYYLPLVPIVDHGTGIFTASEAVSFYPSVSADSSVGLTYSPNSTLQVSDLYSESQSITQFIKGVEEANKFLVDSSELVVSAKTTGLYQETEEQFDRITKEEERDFGRGFRGRKQSSRDSSDLEAERDRSTKQAATYDVSEVRSDMFDKVLLYHAGDKNELVVSLRTTLQSAASTKKTEEIAKLSGGAKGRGKKNSSRKEVVDLRTLLVNCAQAVAADDRRTSCELLRQIRHHSSPTGDGNQRLAHYLGYALEARLAGTGSQIYKELTCKRTTAADVLKAYALYLAACPFKKLSNFFSNKSIAMLTRKARRIHIIDFGILYGFQWPTFIQRQSMREGGPPMLKITGIDFPQPGFRPAERVEETGRRLENYAEEFKVPFEYHAIAKRWDTIQPEDFDIHDEDVLIVNCIYRMKNLPDETMSVESARNTVLKMIRKLNPNLFIHGIVNGAYNAPFFLTRFREAIFHFSAQFDMLETIVPRDYVERMLIERDLLAREALNVIACEGWERVERPETYKQWQIRNIRAGFRQLPLHADIKQRVKFHTSNYHKDFVTDEDSNWLLLGWKGRINFALSTWEPS